MTVRSNSTGRKNRRKGRTSDPEADWGKHETKRVNSDGRKWTKVKTWFGYGLHIMADTKYELPVAFSVTRASVSEVKELEGMAELLFAKEPELGNRCRYLSANRGLDSGPLKKKFWNIWGIRPIIDNKEKCIGEKRRRGRAMWRGRRS